MGKSAILRPRRVNRPSSSRADSAYNSSRAVNIVFVGGGSCDQVRGDSAING